MKSLCTLFLGLFLFYSPAYGQDRSTTKVYLYNYFGADIRTAIAPGNPLKTSLGNRVGYVLIETDMDSLGLLTSGNQTVYLRFSPGKTYYYMNTGHVYAYKEATANEFWLTIAGLYNSKFYRRYSITTKSGLVQIE